MERYALDVNTVAKGMFPDAKHPDLALARVLKQGLPIDTEQISWLASHIGVTVSELFEITDGWRGTCESGHLVFKKGEYSAKLNYGGVFCTLYKNNEVIEEILYCPQTVSVTEFINNLNTKVNGTN